MTRTCLLIALLLCSNTVHAASQTLTLLQWNVFHGGRGTDDRDNPARQVNWIAAKHPDIVTLNEVTGAQSEDYRQRLETATGETWYAHFVRAQDDGIGNGILSRHPIVTTSEYQMRAHGVYRRAVAAAAVDLSGTIVNVLATHLDNANSEMRSAQSVELLAFLAGFSGPTIVAGDLNASPDSPEIRALTARLDDAWTEAVAANRATAYPDNPAGPDTRTRRARIDYVLHSNGLSALQAEIPDQRDLSETGVAVQVGTTDDAGVRPSDHNFVFVVLGVGSVSSRAAAPRP
jgi:endonuclease/exonuclease/phosphatase family metal-dependent hydrolase